MDHSPTAQGPRTAAKSSERDEDRYRDVGRLLIRCPDRPGIVFEVSQFLYRRGANILESQQYSTDPFGGTFFLRLEFYLPGLAEQFTELEYECAALATSFDMSWRLAQAGRRKRVAILASKADHALQEILWRWRSGELRADVRMVISNHPDLEEKVRGWGIDFRHVPVAKENKAAAAAEQLKLLVGEVDLIVLARYMRVLSGSFLQEFPSQVINIHHSFLPAFVGANPYGAAAERGVKLIGATAHYVTEELDAGPIIEQDVVRVDHRHSTDDLRRMGRYVERVVLARAVSWHLEDRVIVHQNKTIVFA
ncbi:MAG: formyltetrahydrofolate deformylase [Streptosporangiaceae bacterium]